jgi:hypothetical protein
VAHGRGYEVVHRHRAEPPQRLPEPGRRSGDAARRRADVEHLRRLVEQHRDRDEVGAALGTVAPRHLDEEVQQHVLVGGVDQHEAAGTEPGERALGSE